MICTFGVGFTSFMSLTKRSFSTAVSFFQVEYVRDMEREVNYMQEELENVKEISESLPDICPKSNELCLEDQC